MKQIKISMEDYTKLCDIAIEKGKSPEDTLIDLLEIAGEYDVTKIKKDETTKHRVH